MSITLLTSKSCGPCTVVKNKLKALNIEVDTKDFTIPEDQEFFRKHNIKSVPRLLIENGADVEIIQGIDDIVDAIKKHKEENV